MFSESPIHDVLLISPVYAINDDLFSNIYGASLNSLSISSAVLISSLEFSVKQMAASRENKVLNF